MTPGTRDMPPNFDTTELAHLTAAVATIQAWNGIAVGFQFAPPVGE